MSKAGLQLKLQQQIPTIPPDPPPSPPPQSTAEASQVVTVNLQQTTTAPPSPPPQSPPSASPAVEPGPARRPWRSVTRKSSLRNAINHYLDDIYHEEMLADPGQVGRWKREAKVFRDLATRKKRSTDPEALESLHDLGEFLELVLKNQRDERLARERAGIVPAAAPRREGPLLGIFDSRKRWAPYSVEAVENGRDYDYEERKVEESTEADDDSDHTSDATDANSELEALDSYVRVNADPDVDMEGLDGVDADVDFDAESDPDIAADMEATNRILGNQLEVSRS